MKKFREMAGTNMFFAGIDVGSNTTKAVITNHKKIIGQAIRKTGGVGLDAAKEVFHNALEKARVSKNQIQFSVSTGYGRNIISSLCNKQVTEISCFARGAYEVNNKARTVIDIGGQDSKVIKLDKTGRVISFEMNDKCSAGTGKFLEVMARTLEVELEEMGEKVLKAKGVVKISSTCTVFAESEVISRIAEGAPKDHILKGIHISMANKVAELTKRVGIEPEVVMAGGVAHNVGIVSFMSEILNTKVSVITNPQLLGAYGAALIAYDIK